MNDIGETIKGMILVGKGQERYVGAVDYVCPVRCSPIDTDVILSLLHIIPMMR